MTDRPTGAAAGADLAQRTHDGDRRALARLLTAVENRTPAGEAGLRRLYPLAGTAHLVGPAVRVFDTEVSDRFDSLA